MARKRLDPITKNDKILYHCLTCNSFKPKECFSIRNDTDNLRGTCNKCRTKESAYYHRTVRKRMSPNEAYFDIEEKKRWLADPLLSLKKYMLRLAKNSAKNRNIELTITLDDIIIPKKCPILDVVFNTNNIRYTYSVDRIDNSKGYIPGNISIISNQANAMKRDSTKEELISFGKNIETYIVR